MPPEYTQFKGVTALGDSLVSDQLEANLINFFDWSFLQVGGFFNVTFPGTGTRLRLVSDPDYQDGQVWEGYRQEWVWEQSLPSGEQQPVGISGVWVNNSFVPYGSGFSINYPMGRVVFDSPLPTTARVACEFSFRRVRMATSDAEWFQDLQFNTLELSSENEAQFLEVASGAWNVLAKNRIQLPVIVVEAVSRVRMKGLQIGSKARVHEQDVIFHVLADTPFDRKQLHDIVIEQWNHQLVLFDKNQVDDADAWPLDEEGQPRPSGLTYPEMVEQYRWRVLSVTEMRSEPQTSLPPLYRATCRATVELDLP